jgi:hypothetical protein
MSTTDELVRKLREWDHCWPACWLETATIQAADAIEALTRERDEAREACAMNNDTHSRISADYTQTIRALEARIAKLEADKVRLREALVNISTHPENSSGTSASWGIGGAFHNVQCIAAAALEATP